MFHLGINDISVSAPTNVIATALTHCTVEVTWDKLSTAAGYIISYTTTALYVSDGSVRIKDGGTTYHTLTSLQKNTPYIITVQAIASDGRKSVFSNEVSVKTHAVGKFYHMYKFSDD